MKKITMAQFRKLEKVVNEKLRSISDLLQMAKRAGNGDLRAKYEEEYIELDSILFDLQEMLLGGDE